MDKWDGYLEHIPTLDHSVELVKPTIRPINSVFYSAWLIARNLRPFERRRPAGKECQETHADKVRFTRRARHKGGKNGMFLCS